MTMLAMSISNYKLHSLVVREFMATDPEVLGSIPSATKFSEK
jgi:hypothetical protein